MADKETLAVYAEKAADYRDKFATLPTSSHLQAFMDALPENARVLDLGCGAGNASAAMRDFGLRVDAMDASTEMAKIARDTFGIDVIIQEFASLDATAVYDGVYANFSLLHAPKSEMPGHLRRLRKALKPGGRLHVGLKTGTGEKRDALGRFYAFYGDAELTNLLTDAGFTVADKCFGKDEGLDGTIAPWMIVVAHA